MLVGTPEHGNLGDHAIAQSVYEFVKEHYNNKEILEIPSFVVFKHTLLFRIVFNNKIILINGGGYLGTLWLDEEKMVLKVIETFKKNKIVILPQSIYYDEKSTEGRERLEIAKNIYSGHSNLTLCARDKVSYEFCKKTFRNITIELIPDMVLNFKCNYNDNQENNILFCFRKDKESIFTEDKKEIIIDKIMQYIDGNSISYVDTVLDKKIYQYEREKEVNDIMNVFYNAKIVFTDRLHGMVFSAITGTPCIAFGNCNHKVKGVFEWIRMDNNYIKYISNIDDLEKNIKELKNNEKNKYSNKSLELYYKKLIEILR